MIFDTTQIKAERKIEQRLEETDIFKALIEAAARRDDNDYGGCSCHIAPPCSYCVAHSECALCNNIVLNDYMVELNDEWVCEKCGSVTGKSDDN